MKGALEHVAVTIHPLEWKVWPLWHITSDRFHCGGTITIGPFRVWFAYRKSQ